MLAKKKFLRKFKNVEAKYKSYYYENLLIGAVRVSNILFRLKLRSGSSIPCNEKAINSAKTWSADLRPTF